MQIFTLEEANSLIPTLEPMLEEMRNLYAHVNAVRDDARAAADSSEAGGGMEGGTKYVNALYKIGKLTTEIHELGADLKDYERGLIDFPSMRGERLILLCWQLGEGPEIAWWHEPEAGFAGRQRL
jgi:hypothetical protein